MINAEALIAEALIIRAKQVAAALTPNPLTVSEPGVSFTPPVNSVTKRADPYLEITILFNMTNKTGIPYDSDVEYKGLFQLSVFWPSNEGMLKPLRIASQIMAQFSPGTRIENNGLFVLIEAQPEVAQGIEETDWLQIPVTVPWRVVAPAPTN